MSGEAQQPPVGTVAEETVKLLQALQGWAETTGGEYAEATSSAAAAAARKLHDVNEHVATGGPDCTYCPLCQVIGVVRETSPEVRHHLAAAATSLLQAAAGMLATHVPEQPTGRGHTSAEKIVVSDDDEREDD